MMGVDDLFEKEVVLAVGTTAALMSGRARRVIRRGAVYGIAGVISAGETVASAAKRVGRDAERVASNGRGEPDSVDRPKAARRTKTA
jgi:hypothetical protein